MQSFVLSKGQDNPKKSIGCCSWITVVLLLLVVVVIFSSLNGSNNNIKNQPTNTGQNNPTELQEVKSVEAVFDVPSLVDKTIDQIRDALGKPKDQSLEPTKEQITLGAKEWDNTFEKDGQTLLVTFNYSNRKVVDFFIDTDDSSGRTKDTDRLLKLGNLLENSPRYKVEFVKTIKDPSYYTGVKVVPK